MTPAAAAPPAGKGGREPGASPARKQGRPGGPALQRGGGPGAGTVRLAPEAELRFRPGAKKRGVSGGYFELYRKARTVSEFFYLPATEALVKADLTNDLKKQLCETSCLGRRDFKKVMLDHAGGCAHFWRPRSEGGRRTR